MASESGEARSKTQSTAAAPRKYTPATLLLPEDEEDEDALEACDERLSAEPVDVVGESSPPPPPPPPPPI